MNDHSLQNKNMYSFILSMISLVKLKNKTLDLYGFPQLLLPLQPSGFSKLSLHQPNDMARKCRWKNEHHQNAWLYFVQRTGILGASLEHPFTTCGPLQAGPQDGVANIHYLGHPEPFAQGHKNRRSVERVGEGCGDQGCDRQRRHHCMHHIKEFSEAAAHRQSSLTHTPPGLSLLHLTPSAGSP